MDAIKITFQDLYEGWLAEFDLVTREITWCDHRASNALTDTQKKTMKKNIRSSYDDNSIEQLKGL